MVLVVAEVIRIIDVGAPVTVVLVVLLLTIISILVVHPLVPLVLVAFTKMTGAEEERFELAMAGEELGGGGPTVQPAL